MSTTLFATIREAALAVMLVCFVSFSHAQSAVTPAGTGTAADPYQITVLGNLVWMGNNASSSSGKHYKQMNDINAAATITWNGGAGFVPIGNSSSAFRGTYDGDSRQITGLHITRSGNSITMVGLFGYTNGATIRNLAMTGGSVSVATTGNTYAYAGSLVGLSANSTISDCSGTGNVFASSPSGNALAGGLIGSGNSLTNCYAAGNVTAHSQTSSTAIAGGLMGELNLGTIANCYATGKVLINISVYSSSAASGGLVGSNTNGTIINCYATGNVEADTAASSYAGGLVGNNSSGTITYCYALGNATAKSIYSTSSSAVATYAGGVAGFTSGKITNCFAEGNATATSFRTACYGGGLAGFLNLSSILTNCYSIGKVTATSTFGTVYPGGFVGQRNSGTITSCFWDTVTSGQTTSSGGTGKSTADMKKKATYTGWDFEKIWSISEGSGYPDLCDEYGAVSVTIQGGVSGAQWRIADLTSWTSSGTTIMAVPVGTYTVEFSTVPNYETPASRQITVTEDQTVTLTVVYRNISAVETSEAFLY